MSNLVSRSKFLDFAFNDAEDFYSNRDWMTNHFNNFGRVDIQDLFSHCGYIPNSVLVEPTDNDEAEFTPNVDCELEPFNANSEELKQESQNILDTVTERKRELWNVQIELQEEMQSKGLNLVTCCNCDTVILHRNDDNKDVIDCHGCGTEVGKSDCTDYFYKGMPEAD
jgi:hypothetical protein